MLNTPPDSPAGDPALRARVLVEALPYIQRFHGQLLVIKLGGSAMEEPEALESLLQDLVLLRFVGMRPLLVHGGGGAITEMSKALGLSTQFVDGLRVTDAETMEVAKMVLTGKITPGLVGAIHRLGGRAVGLSGEDGPTLLVSRQLGPKGEDLGWVGRVEQVNPEPMLSLCAQGVIPVLASVGLGYDGQSYNVNADTVAAAVAEGLAAAKLLVLTDVPGVMDAEGELCGELTPEGAERLIDQGAVKQGMIPKLRAACAAARAGVTVHVIDGRVPHSVLLELLTEAGVGTMIGGAGSGE